MTEADRAILTAIPTAIAIGRDRERGRGGEEWIEEKLISEPLS